MGTKYFLYARKSTEDEERQVMSIEAQIAELTEYAKREKITIAEQFIESKSAKAPGREIFNQMIQKIHSSTEPVGIMAWHPDRLARNSVDGGQVIYLIDTGKVISLKFPTFWFEPTPQGKFMLQVAFGQSKYYSDNLSENVKRGFRQKLRRGEWPSLAPLGYVNNPKTRNIEPDPVKARCIVKAFEEYAEGKHTLQSLSERLSLWGIVSKTGKPLVKSAVQRMLTCKAYIGLISRDKDTYEGNFEAIVSPATFEKVQELLKSKARPRHSKQKHNFPFLGLLDCGECGSTITAQHARGQSGGLYRYYRCTKWRGRCSQKYLREDLLADQLKERIAKVAVDPEWANRISKYLDTMEKEEAQAGQGFALNLDNQIRDTQEKLDKLVNAFLDNTIDKNTYLAKKEELMTLKTTLAEKKTGLGRKGKYRNEPFREWLNICIHADKLASSNNLDEIKTVAEKIVTNPRLLDKRVVGDFARHFELVWKYKGFSAEEAGQFHQRLASDPNESPECIKWSGRRDLNPRPLAPQASALAKLRYFPIKSKTSYPNQRQLAPDFASLIRTNSTTGSAALTLASPKSH